MAVKAKIRAYLTAGDNWADNPLISLVWEEGKVFLVISCENDEDFFGKLEIANNLPGVSRVEVIYEHSCGGRNG